MKRTPENAKEQPTWTKAGECLYRYEPSGGYYARLKTGAREIRRSLATKHLPEARRKLRDLRGEIERTDPALYRTTLAETADRWLALQGHLAAATIRRKTHIVRRIKADWPAGADVPILRVKDADIREWLASYAFGPPAHNLHLESVKAIFDYAERNEIIVRNPAAHVERQKKVKPRRATPSYADFLRIVADVRAQPYNGHGAGDSADVILFMGEQGVGQAEVAGLKRQHVNLVRGELTLYRQKTKTEFTVPIMPNARPILEHRMAATAGDDRGVEAPLFPFSEPKKALAGACGRLKLPGYAPRALRRVFVTRAIVSGVDVQTIAGWQGHSDGGKLILDTYGHVFNHTRSAEMAARMSTGN